VRVLVVDDNEPWRRFFSSALQKVPEYQVIGEASDGLEAVRQAQLRQPDLILLDIGVPTLNGIEAAGRIREVSPTSIILFVSENRSLDIVEKALSTGACGYVVKSDAASDLMLAVKAVLQGKQFVSASLARRDVTDATNEHIGNGPQRLIASYPPKKVEIRGIHDAAFYPDDASLVDGYARFIKSALERGSTVTFIATDSHRISLLQRLKAHAVDVDAFIEQGRYTSLDVIEALSTVMGSSDLPDPLRCAKALGDLIPGSATARAGHHRVAACGEFAPVLLKQGKVEAAIQMEHLTDQFVRNHEIDIFCGYSSIVLPLKKSSPILERICAEHSAVHGLGY
jgi:DNA-binding NarL/FixJ family response regulator